MLSERFNDYVNTHPKECLRVLVILISGIWQTPIMIVSLFCWIGVRRFAVSREMILIIGIIFPLILILWADDYHQLLLSGWLSNKNFWQSLLFGHYWQIFNNIKIIFILGLSPFFTAVLNVIDLIPDKPYQKEMQALQKGKHIVTPEISDKEVQTALAKINDSDYDATVLGVSKYTGKCVTIPDWYINQVLLVLGTTGSGKTITLRRFYQRAILKGYPLIIVDGKPDPANIEWLMKLAEKHNQKFFGFNCGNYLPYDPLSNGGHTELKDKIISLKDEWSSDHYRSIAEDYLQATFEVLLRSGKSFDLKRVVECLNYDELIILAREVDDDRLMRRVKSLEQYDREDITGLQAHLNILIHSELGKYFDKNADTFTLLDVIEQDAVVYFALPALRFPSFSKVLGKLVINDLKAVIDRDHKKRIFTVFDEFSVFAGEQVLNLVNMGRGKGVHAVFGTQGLADLDRVDVAFKSQMLNCVNTLICHRLNDQQSAETVASWVGTTENFTVTAQLNSKEANSGMGSVRVNKEFIVHPDAIKQKLLTGEVFYISKLECFFKHKIKVINVY
ncbi:MAG TPA: type IV secretion system DNA-binding domain-containing protein [Gammaproteobacteria bacterium]|nr:type IV secretion system DNA-binding domain-containing protein [Gammaproteobacteria bacterium]